MRMGNEVSVNSLSDDETLTDKPLRTDGSWIVGFLCFFGLIVTMGLVGWLSQFVLFASVANVAWLFLGPRYEVFTGLLTIAAGLVWGVWFVFWVVIPTTRNFGRRIGFLGLDFRGIQPHEVKGAVIGWFPGLEGFIRLVKARLHA